MGSSCSLGKTRVLDSALLRLNHTEASVITTDAGGPEDTRSRIFRGGRSARRESVASLGASSLRKHGEKGAPEHNFKINITTNLCDAEHSQFQYKKGQLIGKGTFGRVYQCLNLNTGEIFVAKTTTISGSLEEVKASVDILNQEIDALNSLQHPNIVRYIATEITQVDSGVAEVDIILEFVSGGSLRDCLDKFSLFEERVASLYMRQILEALAFLHEKSILHRDLKCANILIDASGTIKLSDFGCCKKLDKVQKDEESQQLPESIKGSPYWMAPEVISRKGLSQKSDVWSVGCVLLEMLTGRPPWSDKTKNVKHVYNLILSKALPTLPPGISENCKDFLLKTLTFDFNERLSAEELLEHPYIKDPNLAKVQTFTTDPQSESKEFPAFKNLRSEQSQSNLESQASNRGPKKKTFVINLSKGLKDSEQTPPVRRQTYDFQGFKGLVSLDVRRSAETGLALRNKVDPVDEREEKPIEKGAEDIFFGSNPSKNLFESPDLQTSQLKNLSKPFLPEEEVKNEVQPDNRKEELSKWEEAMRNELNNVSESLDMSMSGVKHTNNLMSEGDIHDSQPEKPLLNPENPAIDVLNL